MAPRRKSKSELPVITPDAAGADIGATEIYVCSAIIEGPPQFLRRQSWGPLTLAYV